MTEKWQDHLRDLIEQRSAAKPRADISEARRRLREFIDQIVMPAFRALEQELTQYDREVQIDRRPFQAAITVFHDGREEFSYAIRGRAYHKMSLAFPAMKPNGEPQFLSGEIYEGGEKHRYKLEEFTVDGVIWDFLDAYEKWMGW